jgi:hypothetical protein
MGDYRNVKGIKGSRVDTNLATKQDGGKNAVVVLCWVTTWRINLL